MKKQKVKVYYILYDDLKRKYVYKMGTYHGLSDIKWYDSLVKFDCHEQAIEFIKDYKNKDWHRDWIKNGRVKKMALRPIKRLKIE